MEERRPTFRSGSGRTRRLPGSNGGALQPSPACCLRVCSFVRSFAGVCFIIGRFFSKSMVIRSTCHVPVHSKGKKRQKKHQTDVFSRLLERVRSTQQQTGGSVSICFENICLAYGTHYKSQQPRDRQTTTATRAKRHKVFGQYVCSQNANDGAPQQQKAGFRFSVCIAPNTQKNKTKTINKKHVRRRKSLRYPPA